MPGEDDVNEGYTKGITSKIHIPFFDPACTKITARAWLAYVELARDSAGQKTIKHEAVGEVGDPDYAAAHETQEPVWSDKQTCTNAMLLLQGTANKWGVHILENEGDELKSWDTFKKSFKARFIQQLTLQERINLRDLKQSASETCRDFYDKCRNNIHLFYENEWESPIFDSTTAGAPWAAPGVKVTRDHIKVSKLFLEETKKIEIKLAFAAGLKEVIKKQVLFQASNSVDDILEIAQRVEAGLKELKKADFAVLDVDHEDYDAAVDAAAINFKKKLSLKFKAKGQGGAKQKFGGGGGGGQLKCFYCLKSGHFKDKCITMKNDRKKGIYRSNINLPPKARASNNSVDGGEDSDSDSEDSGKAPSVSNCMTDLDVIGKILNHHSV